MVADSRLRKPTAHVHGYRLACSAEKEEELERHLTRYRKRKEWYHAALEKVVSKIRRMDWGVMAHGGNRRRGVLGPKSAETAQYATQMQAAARPHHRHRQKKALAVVVSPNGGS